MKHLSKEIVQTYLNVKPAYKRIYLTLRQAILSGEIDPDEKLSEDFLAWQFGTSRTPLRRAMEQLKNEGIIGIKPGNSSLHISKKDINCLLDFDVLLESHAAFLAAQNGVAQEDMGTLRGINERLRNLDDSLSYTSPFEKDLMGPRDLNLQFHLLIARLSRNKYLYQSIANVRTRLRQYSTLDAFPQNETPAEYYRNIIVPCHDEILNAIENGDAESAKAWMYTDAIRAKTKYFHSYKNPYVAQQASRHSAVPRNFSKL